MKRKFNLLKTKTAPKKPDHPVKARTLIIREQERSLRQLYSTEWWRREHKGGVHVQVAPGTYWNRARRRIRART